MCSKVFFLLFLLQRHYFHCKNQFDITNLNSTYTQVSARISSSVVKARWKCVQLRCVYEWQIILITWAMCVCVHRCRVKVYIRPWVSWICCLTTLRRIWLLNGIETTSEDLRTLIKVFFFVNFTLFCTRSVTFCGVLCFVSVAGCWIFLMSFLKWFFFSKRGILSEDKFPDHIASYTYEVIN